MKKFLAILLSFIMLLSVCSCEKKTELTVDNVGDYLSFTASCDSDIEESSGSAGGWGYYRNYSGDASAHIRVTNQSGARFENVTLTLELYTVSFNSSRNGMVCGWEFRSGNIGTVDSNTSIGDAMNSKRITVNLPYDGDWDSTEQLELVLYGQWSDLVVSPTEPRVSVRVVDVSGTVVEE